MNEENRQLKYGALISYLAIFINTATALLYLPWMAQKIGQSNYALYNLSYSFVSLFLSDFGLSSAAARFIAKYRAENQEEKANILLSMITKLYTAIDLIIGAIMIVVYLFIGQIYKGLTPAELEILKPLFLINAIYSLVSFPFMSLSGILNAYEKFIQLKLCDLGQKLTNVLLIIVSLLSGKGVIAVMACNAISGILFILIKIIIVRKETPIRLKWKLKDPALLNSVFSFSVWTAVSSIAQRCIFSLAPSILGIVSNSTEIAIFSPANALEGYFYMFAAAVNGLFLARISRYIANNERDRIYTLMVKVGRYQMTVMGLIFIGFISLGKDFMIAWMGPEYERSAICAALIFLPDLLLFTEQIASSTIIAENKVKYSAFSNIGMAVICVALSFPLSAEYGALGSCLAIAISYFVSFIYMNYIYHKVLHLDVLRFFRECYTSFILPFALTFVISRLLGSLIPFSGWIGLLIRILMITMIYTLLVWTLSLKKDEKEWFLINIHKNHKEK